MADINVLYFASLRDAAGAASETLETDAADLAALYAQVRDRHGFALPVDRPIAEALQAPLLADDVRLSRSTGPCCIIEVIKIPR